MPRVLYIDDDFANRLLVKRVLMAEGFQERATLPGQFQTDEQAWDLAIYDLPVTSDIEQPRATMED